ncbi:alpha/beta hydrolase [Pseudoduganella sp. LjRoot289]|uniref:alpha/beta hydrolase n=1 Tax=Pseudoduganella sp. LjRoot289 TaxID=3342314 RepID=UPI003ECCCCBF
MAATILLGACLAWAGGARAEVAAGGVMRVDTRGVSVPLYAAWREDAVATVVLYSGGNGGYGQVGADGWPGSQNFLVRAARLFAAQPFNVVLVGLAPDLRELDGRARLGDSHAQDNQAIFKAIKAKSAAPLWLVGTSMGTISVAAAAIRDGAAGDVAGIVLTSTVTAYKREGAVPTQDIGKIKVPVLVVHHQQDACGICRPWEAKTLASRLGGAPVTKTMLVDGGSEPGGDVCGALHYHGFIGMEQQAVDLIANWIRHPAP